MESMKNKLFIILGFIIFVISSAAKSTYNENYNKKDSIIYDINNLLNQNKLKECFIILDSIFLSNNNMVDLFNVGTFCYEYLKKMKNLNCLFN